MKHTHNGIELTLWQLFALLAAALACLFALSPFISRSRSNKCGVISTKNETKFRSFNMETASDYHRRYVRDLDPPDQCNDIPPLCSETTTLSTISTISPSTTTRSTVTAISVTRPIISTFPTSPRTTTTDPWINATRPYNSWRLPAFAKPIDYTLHIACRDCFTLISNLSTIAFYGQVSIRVNILNATEYLVLHAKNLNIIQVRLTGSNTETPVITYLPEYEMVHLDFSPSSIDIGEITLQIDYTGAINEHDHTGFYREVFWKSIGEIS